MGVPSFYRWLTNKYPNVVVNAIEERGGESIDTSLPNPNGIEFDNLYLDMNGIIHPCFHPDDDPCPPVNFEDVFNNIYQYIDRLFNIVRPRKLLYLAIDGVAPRAKMNQQRARRFRTAKDNAIVEAEEERLRRQFEIEGKQVLPRQESEISDSNIITPGTVFMYQLSKKLESYIKLRMQNDAGWKNIKVILSDANVPGEGEHKIMSFIRLQRSSPDYSPNTRHCLYGLDADLIMLVLATHELHFSILREDVLVQEQNSAIETRFLEAKLSAERSRRWYKQAQTVKGDECLIKKRYQFLYAWILREYLELDMEISDPPENFKFDFERIVDDFIFMCFFAGNDFLPHMPTLEIHEGAIDLLLHVYKKEFKSLGGYLVDMQRVEDTRAGYLKSKRVEKFILKVGAFEDKIFKKRLELNERRIKRILYDLENAKDEEEEEEEENLGAKLELNSKDFDVALLKGRAPASADSAIVSMETCSSSSGTDIEVADDSEVLKNTKELKEKLRENIRKASDTFKNGILGKDKVRLGEAGWKERYYEEKFSADSAGDIESIRKAIVQKYTEGLCWVLLYYFSGVPSWTWFYPYHYGPFASDLKGLAQVGVKFQKGLPFKPFDQLMGVLPPRSAHSLPKAYHSLMTDSSIDDFYPTDFEVDMNGKRFVWQGICKLPFIEEERLLTATRKLEKELKEDEAVRNGENFDQLFARSSSKLGSQILSLYKNQAVKKQNERTKIDTLSEGLNGFMHQKAEDSTVVISNGAEEIHDDHVLCVFYELPNWCLHIPRLLEGVDIPPKTITEDDIMETQLWHEYQGNRPNNRPHCRQQRRNALNNQSSHSYSGWRGGRGKRLSSTGELMSPSLDTENGVGYYYLPVCQQDNKFGTASRTYGSNGHWKPVNSIQGESNGFQDLRISEPDQGFSSYRGNRSVNPGVWSSGNGSTAPWNHDWSMGVQSTAAPFARGRGRLQGGPMENTSRTCQNGQYLAAASSVQGHGKGHCVPNASATSWQASGRGQNAPNVSATSNWSPSGTAATTIFQAHGRGRYVPNTSAPPFHAVGRGQYVPNASATSMQTSGRGCYAPNVSATSNWSSPRAVATSTQAHGRGHCFPSASATSIDAIGRGQYVPRPSTSVQGCGRGQYVPRPSTSVQGRGRGQYVPRPSTSNWRPTNSPTSSVTDKCDRL